MENSKSEKSLKIFGTVKTAQRRHKIVNSLLKTSKENFYKMIENSEDLGDTEAFQTFESLEVSKIL